MPASGVLTGAGNGKGGRGAEGPGVVRTSELELDVEDSGALIA